MDIGPQIEGNNMRPILSYVSLYIPNPVAIYVTSNTFVRFNYGSSSTDGVRMIFSINAEEEQLWI